MILTLEPGQGVDCPTPRTLISAIVRSNPRLARLGSFSKTLYDTAWLSMIYQPHEEQGEIRLKNLFPQCLKFVLDQQDVDGGWASQSSPFDRILNSLAALLALVTYQTKCGAVFETYTLEPRVQQAKAKLQEMLRIWDVDGTVQVGFEVLVVSLLNQLQSFAIVFDFPAIRRLESLYRRKMQRFTPRLIYAKKQTTILHSLEALVDIIDFDRVKHHCYEDTGILASPSATAAYLIHSTEWDNKAETYLRTVLEACNSDTLEAVPSAFPTPVFELSWILSSMLSCVVESGDLDRDSVSMIASFLEQSVQDDNGTVGFAPGLLSDADDTARTLMTLQLLGRCPSYTKMIEEFEAQDHFRTYDYERNPSFSANCNVLLALAYRDKPDDYAAQIGKALTFVLQKWELNDVSDKWNVSQQYCALLMMQAFVRILELHESGKLQSLGDEVLAERMPIAICQILIRTLASQSLDGGWNQSIEETSYSVLTIAQGLRVPWNHKAREILDKSFIRGKDYVRRQYPLETKNHHLWVEKTMYEPTLLKVAYCSMAIHANPRKQYSTEIFNISEIYMKKMAYLLSGLPNFTPTHLAHIELILVEASLLSRYLRRIRQEVITRDQVLMSKDKYLDFIPVIWTVCNAKGKHILPAAVVRDMVRLSLLNYQVDEYMETVVRDLPDMQIEELITALRNEFAHGHDWGNLYQNGDDKAAGPPAKRVKLNLSHNCLHPDVQNHSDQGTLPVGQVLLVLRRYIASILHHEAVRAAPMPVRNTLAKELCAFLHAHITHNADSAAFQKSHPIDDAQGFACTDFNRNSYFKWVNTTGADDTSCPFSFQYFSCLISHALIQSQGHSVEPTGAWFCFEDVRARYVAEALARRLAAMCRMYNDYGSAARDRAEANLNSLDFIEFHHRIEKDPDFENGKDVVSISSGPANHMSRDASSEKRRKEELMYIAEFERHGVEHAMDMLRKLTSQETVVDMLAVLVDVTDTFGLVYVQKDIASTKMQK